MLEVMPDSTGKILWLRAAGRLTDRDYREVFIPSLEAVIREHGRVRILFHLAPNFQGWTPGALWEDLKLDLKHRGDFEKVALVGAPAWADALMKLFGHFMPGQVMTFLREQLTEAWIWIQEP
ncbi:MAG: STAS/SEC14 domain-containing protein [Deltaproteobacteria bacterium]|nr:STAS/SEC14 domain-containing protein [Deltaproteobacteria bacterium]